MRLTLEEQETTLAIRASDRSVIEVYSNDPVWQKRLEDAGAVILEEVNFGGKFYRLDARQIILRTMDQVEAASQRAKRILRAPHNKDKKF